jgi:MFS family permease
MFSAKQRGLAMTLFASAPFMGPALGPVVGMYYFILLAEKRERKYFV